MRLSLGLAARSVSSFGLLPPVGSLPSLGTAATLCHLAEAKVIGLTSAADKWALGVKYLSLHLGESWL